MTEALIGVGVVLSLNLLGLAYTYGRLFQKVDFVLKSLSNSRNHLSQIDAKLEDIAERVSRIEGKLSIG